MLDLRPSAGTAGPPSDTDSDAARLGRAFIDALVTCDFDRLESLLAPDVRFRALTPRSFREASTAAGARAIVEGWFSGTDERVLLGSRVEYFVDRLALGYRIELTEDGERRVVEQHVAAAVEGDQCSDLALVCSGFRPLGAAPHGDDRPAGSRGITPAARLDGTGLSCATLTPAISTAIRGLDAGAVLEIVTDDPEAEEGLRSWTRLTGNELVAADAGPGPTRRFTIRRSPRDATVTTMKGAN